MNAPGRTTGHHTLHGDEIVEFPVLMQNLSDARRSGTLVVRGPRTAYLYMRLGDLAAGYSGDPEFLGKALVKTGALTWDEFAKFKEFSGATPATFETLLLEQDRVSPHAVRRAHEFSVREVLGEIVTWAESHTRLREGSPPSELVRVNLPPDDVSVPTKPALLEAIYQLDEWPRIRGAIPSDRDIPNPIGGGASGSKAELLGLVDGQRDVEEIVVRASMSRFDAMVGLRELHEEGLIQLMDFDGLIALSRRLRGSNTALETPEKLIKLYERAEELGHLSVEAGQWVAEAHEVRGDLAAASARYLSLGRLLADHPDTRGEATNLFKKALALRPEDDSLQRELIESLIRQGRMEDAALQAEVYVAWLRESKEPAFAFRAAREVLEKLEEFEEILVLQAELCVDVGNVAQAITLYRRIAEVRLESDEFEPEEKADALQRILELAPNDRDVQFALGRILFASQPERAIEVLRAFVRGAEADGESARDERVVEAYQLLSRLSPGEDVSGPLALATLSCGDTKKAQQILHEALQRPGKLAADLIPVFRKLLALNKNAQNHLQLAQALIRVGNLDQGVAELRVLAARALGKGNKALALRAYRTALGHNPFDRTIRMALSGLLKGGQDQQARLLNLRALAHIAQVEGKYDLAISTLESLLSEDPMTVSALAQLMECHLHRDGPKALGRLRKFALECRRSGDMSLVRWAVSQAQRLRARPDWFKDLPQPKPTEKGSPPPRA